MLTTKTLRQIRHAVRKLNSKASTHMKRQRGDSSPRQYTPEELREFAQILARMKEDSLQQVQILRESVIGGNPDDHAVMLIQRELRLVGYLDAALARIENGKYGFCLSCGELIDRGRLEAVPHTPLCLKCKSG
ncbi:MAG: TraR/DksA family transcriptional regulator [Ignavibacteriales bacterium]|nr:TraR/DksA family transcriptional regulator [Ignavibacteriales bacterium]